MVNDHTRLLVTVSPFLKPCTRGAIGGDSKTGDGAGMLIQIPHNFFVKESTKIGFNLPEKGLMVLVCSFSRSIQRNGQQRFL